MPGLEVGGKHYAILIVSGVAPDGVASIQVAYEDELTLPPGQLLELVLQTGGCPVRLLALCRAICCDDFDGSFGCIQLDADRFDNGQSVVWEGLKLELLAYGDCNTATLLVAGAVQSVDGVFGKAEVGGWLEMCLREDCDVDSVVVEKFDDF